jgi:hypothetical protein
MITIGMRAFQDGSPDRDADLSLRTQRLEQIWLDPEDHRREVTPEPASCRWGILCAQRGDYD